MNSRTGAIENLGFKDDCRKIKESYKLGAIKRRDFFRNYDNDSKDSEQTGVVTEIPASDTGVGSADTGQD